MNVLHPHTLVIHHLTSLLFFVHSMYVWRSETVQRVGRWRFGAQWSKKILILLDSVFKNDLDDHHTSAFLAP